MESVIRPFGFREFLRHRGEEPATAPATWAKEERSLIEKRFREYLDEGGFPEAQGLDPSLRIELLQGYVDTVLFRDLIERHGVTQVAALRWVTRHCLRNPASRFSVHRLYRNLRAEGHAVAKDGVHDMIGHLVDAFLLGTVALATESERQRNSNPRKVYPADPGLIGAFDMTGRPNLGHGLESVVFVELERRKAQVGYVKTPDGFEVDFLARYLDGGEELIQVCADPSDAETFARELRALGAARSYYPRATRRLLVLNRDQVPSAPPAGVVAQPVYEWLMEGTVAAV